MAFNASMFAPNALTGLDTGALKALSAALRQAGPLASAEDRWALAAGLAHVAFCAPDRVGQAYDALALGWTGQAVGAAPIAVLNQPSLEAPDALWPAYGAVVEEAVAGKLDAGSITARTAALGGMLDEAFRARTAAMSYAYPGVAAIADAALPERVSLARLAACPDGSLGRRFHDLIVDNKFDLEVLDRDAIGLSGLPKPLDWLNTRILQAHDLWHIVAGYETTALHEIAISAFQMAQFGHNYSAQFLSVTAGVGALAPATGYGVLMDVIVSAWRHGRETPALITIPWEREWDRSVEEIRARFGVEPYQSPYPANLIEMLQAAA